MVAASAPADRPAPSFAALCAPLRPALLAKASQLCRDRAAAEDLVQDAYVHALEAWHTFQPVPHQDDADRARAWISRILVNLFRDAYRGGARRLEVLEQGAADIADLTMGAAPLPPDEVVAGSLADVAGDEVRAAIVGLPAIQRDALLRTARGETDEEIAAANGVDRRQARKRRHYARLRVVASLGERRAG